ncbi:MAG: TRAP transporter large permease [Acetivibrionales bacterium]|jgi:tripartite ATP-independent transporter DctM subunit
MLAIFIGLFIAFMLLGVPVAFAMGGTALISALILWGIGDLPTAILVQRLVAGTNSFTMLGVPLFLLAGQLMNGGSVTQRIYDFSHKLVGHLPGGLGHVNVLGSVIFSGMSGTAAADAAGIGTLEIKAMTDRGFDKEFSTAVTGASSLIGPIIPPSVPMVMYGIISGVSISSLFLGGIIPGLLMGLSMSAMVWYYAVKRNYPVEKKATFKEIVHAVRRGFLPLMAPVIIIGGIWTGVFTPTEAAGVAVFYAVILNMFVYRDVTPKQLWQILKNVFIDSACILFVIACVSVYSYVLVRTQIPMILAEGLFAITRNPLGIMIILNIFLLIVGCFMSTAESIMIFTPIFIPMLEQAGIDPLAFGVIMCLNLMIGQLTPPFGIVLFVLTKVSNLSMDKVVKACLPFTIPVLVIVLLCIFFPQIITFLPNLVFGK